MVLENTVINEIITGVRILETNPEPEVGTFFMIAKSFTNAMRLLRETADRKVDLISDVFEEILRREEERLERENKNNE